MPAAIQIVRETAVSTLTPDVVWLGGITPTTMLLRDSSSRKVPVFLHGRAYLPALHLAAAVGDAVGAVEFRVQWEPRRQRLYQRPSLPRHGSAGISGVGLGTTPNLVKYQLGFRWPVHHPHRAGSRGLGNLDRNRAGSRPAPTARCEPPAEGPDARRAVH